ncbi:MAG: hypothetical protein Tsb0027_10090 [Wenzhouxiangellaceae bacterium]
MKNISVKIKNHPCFKHEFSGFDQISTMNLIIGKNNSGKSRLVDLVDMMCEEKWNSTYEYLIRQKISTQFLKSIFREGNGGGVLSGDHWRDNGHHLQDQEISWVLNKNGSQVIELPAEASNRPGLKDYLTNYLPNIKPPLSEYVHFHLLADRDIQPESKSNTIELSSDGKGSSNIIRHFLLSSDIKYTRELVTIDLLSALNEIFKGSNNFNEIYVQEHDKERWTPKPGQGLDADKCFPPR